jgi:hypothetical protein
MINRHSAFCCFLIIIMLGSIPAMIYAQQESSSIELKDVLPSDGKEVDVMELQFPARMQELTQKMQQAIAKDPDWLPEVLKKLKPGETLPYDERLGLSKEQYEEYLGLTKKMTLTKTKTVKARVKQEGDRIELSFGEDLPGINGVIIDLKSDAVSMPAGVATERSQIKASEGQKATGPWNGIQWKMQKIDAESMSMKSIKFALGKMQESPKGILYCDVKLVSGNSKTVYHYVLQYDLLKQ